MTPTLIGMLVFVCTFGGALVGLWLRSAPPDHHLSPDSKDTVKVGIGLIATMTALVLGLVTASTKSAFDALNTAIQHAAADVLALDRTLARFGPESKAARETLAQIIAQRLELTWPQHASPGARRNRLEQRLRGRPYPLQGWQCELSALEDEAPLELPPGASLIQPFPFHQHIRHQA